VVHGCRETVKASQRAGQGIAVFDSLDDIGSMIV
jgi:hypothetical protein